MGGGRPSFACSRIDLRKPLEGRGKKSDRQEAVWPPRERQGQGKGTQSWELNGGGEPLFQSLRFDSWHQTDFCLNLIPTVYLHESRPVTLPLIPIPGKRVKLRTHSDNPV